MDPIDHEAFTGIERLELELIVRDFVTILNDGTVRDLHPFLTEDVRYKPAPDKLVLGRDAVSAMISELRSAFIEWRTTLLSVAVTGHVVLTEQEMILGLPETGPQVLMGFSSFRLDGFRICSWHQVHG